VLLWALWIVISIYYFPIIVDDMIEKRELKKLREKIKDQPH